MNGTGVSPEECKYLEIIEGNNLTEYKMYFRSIGEVQSFLRADPDINSEIFYEQKSKTSSKSCIRLTYNLSIISWIRYNKIWNIFLLFQTASEYYIDI